MKYNWSMETEQMEMKDGWKFVLEECGGQYVIICGIIMMLRLSVNNSDLEQQVSKAQLNIFLSCH